MLVTDRALTKHNHRVAQIDHQLAVIKRELAVINAHCTATPEQTQAALQIYQKELRDASLEALGRRMQLGSLEKKLKKVEAKVRRMQGW